MSIAKNSMISCTCCINFVSILINHKNNVNEIKTNLNTSHESNVHFECREKSKHLKKCHMIAFGGRFSFMILFMSVINMRGERGSRVERRNVAFYL